MKIDFKDKEGNEIKSKTLGQGEVIPRRGDLVVLNNDVCKVLKVDVAKDESGEISLQAKVLKFVFPEKKEEPEPSVKAYPY